MRKRNIEKVADTIFWYTLYLLPILAYLIALRSGNNMQIANTVDFYSFMEGCDLLTSGVISDALFEVLGDGEYGFIFCSGLLAYVAWFIDVSIFHLFADFLLFIPRMAHKWFESFGGS